MSQPFRIPPAPPFILNYGVSGFAVTLNDGVKVSPAFAFVTVNTKGAFESYSIMALPAGAAHVYPALLGGMVQPTVARHVPKVLQASRFGLRGYLSRRHCPSRDCEIALGVLLGAWAGVSMVAGVLDNPAAMFPDDPLAGVDLPGLDARIIVPRLVSTDDASPAEIRLEALDTGVTVRDGALKAIQDAARCARLAWELGERSAPGLVLN